MKFSIILALALASYTTLATAQQDGNFRAKNADDAEKLTNEFKKLTANSPCQDGQNACVNDQFAQCVGGKFALTPCAAGTKCVVLPLVNKPGTSITCDTEADRQARLADARGQQPKRRSPAKNPPNPDSSSQDPKVFRPKNADEAEKLTNDFKQLTENSPCQDGQSACVKDQFAQCVGGKFALTPCAAGTKCVVLPLVNKPGTSITCDTEADRQARLADARGQQPGQQPSQPSAPPATNPKNGEAKKAKKAKQAKKAKGKENNTPQQPNTPPQSSQDPKVFRPKNADEAEKLTNDFTKLTENSPCQDGQNACVKDQFAQCVGGKFALTPCAAGTKCVVLPLVNKPGTSITCDTEADRQARLAEARGQQPGQQPKRRSPAGNPPSSQDPKVFRPKNADEAEKLTNNFKKLTANSPCQNGQNACVNDQFAQCVGGKFALTPCAAGTKCVVLPLVNKPGTSITCDTEADRQARLNEARGKQPKRRSAEKKRFIKRFRSVQIDKLA